MGLLKFPWFHILLDCEDSPWGTECLWKKVGDPIYEKEMFIFCVSLSARNTVSKTKREKKWAKFLGVRTPSRPLYCIGTNQNCWKTPCFAQIFLNIQYSSNYRSMQIIFTSGIGPDTLMNMLKYWIIFLI